MSRRLAEAADKLAALVTVNRIRNDDSVRKAVNPEPDALLARLEEAAINLERAAARLEKALT